MRNSPCSNKHFDFGIPAWLVISALLMAPAAWADGYLVNAEGQPVQASTGCVHTGDWRKSMPTCPEPTVIVEEGKVKIVFALDDSEFFGFDKVQLSDQAKQDLDSLVAAIKNADEVHGIAITGHADRIGPKPYNVQLAERRAQAVANYLVSKGIPEQLIEARGDGTSGPLVTCPNIKNMKKLIRCLAPNRRVDVEVLMADDVNVADIEIVPPGN